MLTVLETDRYSGDRDLSHQTRNTNQSTSSTKSLSVYHNWSALWADFLPTQLRCLTNSLFRSITLTMRNISLLVFFFSLIIFWLCTDFLTGAPKARSFTLILALLPDHNQTNNSQWERKFPSCLDWWRDNTGETPHSAHWPSSAPAHTLLTLITILNHQIYSPRDNLGVQEVKSLKHVPQLLTFANLSCCRSIEIINFLLHQARLWWLLFLVCLTV